MGNFFVAELLEREQNLLYAFVLTVDILKKIVESLLIFQWDLILLWLCSHTMDIKRRPRPAYAHQRSASMTATERRWWPGLPVLTVRRKFSDQMISFELVSALVEGVNMLCKAWEVRPHARNSLRKEVDVIGFRASAVIRSAICRPGRWLEYKIDFECSHARTNRVGFFSLSINAHNLGYGLCEVLWYLVNEEPRVWDIGLDSTLHLSSVLLVLLFTMTSELIVLRAASADFHHDEHIVKVVFMFCSHFIWVKIQISVTNNSID